MSHIPELEKKILDFWEKERIFEKSLAQRQGRPPFVFYEGPPFANARPGIHHVLARAFKDVIIRYKTMQGYYVPRKAGWDTHGLPVEMQVEKELGISSKPEIEKLGIGEFIRRCRESIFTFKKEWEEMTKRMGYWLDLKNAYITCSNQYIESVWWIFQQIWQKGLVYQDYKVVPYCPRCGTSLSDHEVALGYRDATDPSLFVKFPLQKPLFGRSSFLLVWTTTPWTLPANTALAIAPDEQYLQVRQKDETFILAKKRVSVLKGEYQPLKEFLGKELIGLHYQPLYPAKLDKQGYRVVGADFVNLEEGTGIVHIAPAFGAEDLQLAKKEDLPIILNVDEEGRFKEEVKAWAGRFVKEADEELISDLTRKDRVYDAGVITHPYPFCWRCDTPLLYYAKDSWYVKTTAVKEKMLQANQRINWIPAYIKDGRFGNWLKENVDWAVSRERYWGTPLPIWECQAKNCRQKLCIGSIKELSERAIEPFDWEKLDLHRPAIDAIFLRCPSCGGLMQRVKEVLDCWFDSGSMPLAQEHFPFALVQKQEQDPKELKRLMKRIPFPADFIAEGIDQTRGWFYTLLAISTLLDLGPAYENVISLGLVLDEKGQKMSKSKGNIVLPMEMMERYGADAVRLYFYLAPLGETIRFSEKDLVAVFRKFTLTLYHCFAFYQTYFGNMPNKTETVGYQLLDKWIVSRLHEVTAQITDYLESFEVTKAARLLYDFLIFDLSNWYLRRSRKRGSVNFQKTFGRVLLDVSRLSAPFAPFISEIVYQGIRDKQSLEAGSVHLLDWPVSQKAHLDHDLNQKMEVIRQICELGLSLRAQAGIKVRQPLAEMKVKGEKVDSSLLELVADELNLKKVTLVVKGEEPSQDWLSAKQDDLAVFLNCHLSPLLKREGYLREMIRWIQEIRKEARLQPNEKVSIFWQTDDKDLLDVVQSFKNQIEKETKTVLQQRQTISSTKKEINLDDKRIILAFGERL